MIAGCSGPSVAAGVALALLEFAASRGADRDKLLVQAGIDPSVFADGDNRVPFAQYVALMRAGKTLCRDPALGLHFGEAVDFSELSIVGLIGEAAETPAEAFVQVNRYARLIVEIDTGDSDRFALERRDGQIWLIDNRKNPNDFPELTEGGFARGVSGMHHFDPVLTLTAVHVTHPDPGYRSEYERIFRAPVHFASSVNALVMDEAWLNRTIRTQPRYVFGILTRHADTLIARLDDAKTMRGQVEAVLLPVLHTGASGVEAVSARLGIGRHTLFRRLKAEGTTFEKVLDELRRRLALEYLRGQKVSVNETAYLVGFSEPAAFSRAFKRWTGMSPGEARR